MQFAWRSPWLAVCVGKEVPRWRYFDAPALIAGETKYPCEPCQTQANKKNINGLTKQILLETCNESYTDPNQRKKMPDGRWEPICDGVPLTLGFQKRTQHTEYYSVQSQDRIASTLHRHGARHDGTLSQMRARLGRFAHTTTQKAIYEKLA